MAKAVKGHKYSKYKHVCPSCGKDFYFCVLFLYMYATGVRVGVKMVSDFSYFLFSEQEAILSAGY